MAPGPHGAVRFAIALAAACAPAAAAAAEPPPPPPAQAPAWTPPADDDLRGAPLFAPRGEARHFTLTWNPLTLFLVRAEASFEAMLTDHHVIQATFYYGGTRTNPVYPPGATPTATNGSTTLFQALGGEVGYRWYSGSAGPRGLYVAPSFLIAHATASPTRGAEVPFWSFGGALDLGYQAIIADRWVAGLGGGVQYTVPTVVFPPQELPASVYAIRGLRPRMMITVGVAFD